MLTIEKDDFTGLKKINSAFYGLKAFMSFDGPSDIYLRYMRDKTGISDAFDLLYLETENGQGNVCIRVCSSVAKFSGNQEWPHWNDEWPMIVDGERLSLTSTSINSFETDYELKVYNLPIDIFAKICNANEVKFSLRGRNNKIEGAFTAQHLTLFKAFEQYCFGDENEGKKLLDSIGSFVSNSDSSNVQSQGDTTTYSCYSCKANNIVPNNWESFNCHNCKKDNTIIKPKDLTEEERNKHESKVIDLIKEKKIEDAIKYFGKNFGYTENASKLKVKELAEINGLASIYKKYENKQTLHGCLILLVVGFIVMMLVKAC
jgi:hypothetical protein